GAFGNGTKPEVPMKRARHWRRIGGLRIRRPAFFTPDVAFANGTDGIRLNQLHHAAVIPAGMDLDAHLRGELMPRGTRRRARCGWGPPAAPRVARPRPPARRPRSWTGVTGLWPSFNRLFLIF